MEKGNEGIMSSVKLISKSVPNIDGISSIEEFTAYCARVSNPANQLNNETADKLLKYCVKNQHWSIFEMSHFVFEIVTTRDIGRQILRHRSFAFQEFSQRYAEVDDSSFEYREARMQDKKNRQNSIEITMLDGDRAGNLVDAWQNRQEYHAEKSKELYNWAIENGIAKEQARVVLPEGMTLSTMYMAGSLRSWIHYCLLRMDKATQKEHRIVAEEIWNILIKEVPSLNTLVPTDLGE